MPTKRSLINALLLLSSYSAAANALFLDNLDEEFNLTESLSSSYAQSLRPQQQHLTGDECHATSSHLFSDNGLSSGHRNTQCYKTEFKGGNIETYYQTSPNGSSSTGFSWTFE
jgi:hypothetical protein